MVGEHMGDEEGEDSRRVYFSGGFLEVGLGRKGCGG